MGCALQLSLHFNNPIHRYCMRTRHPYHLICVVKEVKVSWCVRSYPYRTESGPSVSPIPIRFLWGKMRGHMDGHVLGSDSEQPRAVRDVLLPGPAAPRPSPKPSGLLGSATGRPGWALTRQGWNIEGDSKRQTSRRAAGPGPGPVCPGWPAALLSGLAGGRPLLAPAPRRRRRPSAAAPIGRAPTLAESFLLQG